MNLRTMIVAVPLCLLLAASVAWASDFRIKGYFKDRATNRIFTIEYRGDPGADQARRYAEQRPYAAGQMTAVYFYPAGSRMPVDGITRAKNLFDANRILYDVPGLAAWRYAYMRGFDGRSQFVDCLESAGHDLCR
ncbi:hypothetical protein Tgr7_0404 [Thioalkalivibrio sulfidiphilus HL-EbGr7]|uniref:Uncharacterized protein n=1 Tax=Thioalkalivibrio sulfidiphilus (strain HL-EbGR7) TaxID=396588 RepID=B8GUZ1_THISH|nr:hypothetical protein [Thioalkalivibrio sulfidiphilus]ACL71502.1 hypothetical protein Tgr7_0404 [Thioalkalivibrio sulfidiphilus HL-EbGr7]